ncbi:MAG: hypothetical protein WCO53_10225 [Deltaproteobacteria bacterium]
MLKEYSLYEVAKPAGNFMIEKGVMATIDSKLEKLRALLSEMGGVVIGYSGGRLPISSRN